MKGILETGGGIGKSTGLCLQLLAGATFGEAAFCILNTSRQSILKMKCILEDSVALVPTVNEGYNVSFTVGRHVGSKSVGVRAVD